MADIKSCCHGTTIANNGASKESVCIDCNKIYDSCRDKDCFENVRVFLTDFGQEIIDKTGSIRVKSAKIIWTNISVNPVQFNRGFYQIYVRFYVKIVFEACVCPGRSQEIDGLAVCEKKVILYGSEGSVSIFKSDPLNDNFCARIPDVKDIQTNLPVAVCEVASPIVLDVQIKERDCNKVCCCCTVDEIPENVCCFVNGALVDSSDDDKRLYVSLGFFSVIRLERPSQYIINASEYCVPDKECVCSESDTPCSIFEKMDFPVHEFCPPSYKQLNNIHNGHHC